MPDVLIVTLDSKESNCIANWLEGRCSVGQVETTPDAELILDGSAVKVILCSDELDGESGLMFFARTRSRWPRTRKILMATNLDGSLFFHVMQEVDVFSYLRRPFEKAELLRILSHAMDEPETIHRPTDAIQIPPKEISGGWRSPLGVGLGLLAGAIVLIAFLIGGLYALKSALGIDFFPDWHLWDLFRG